MLIHRTGRREIAVYDRGDPDACTTVLHLSPDDTRTLAELLGGSPVSEAVAARAAASRAWPSTGSRSPPASSLAGATIADGAVPHPDRRVGRRRRPRRHDDPRARARTRSLRGRRRRSSPSARPTGSARPCGSSSACVSVLAAGERATPPMAFIEIGAVALVLVGAGPARRPPRHHRHPALPAGRPGRRRGRLAPLDVSADFIALDGRDRRAPPAAHPRARVHADELRHGLRTGARPGVVDAVANFTPGLRRRAPPRLGA